MAIGGNMLNLEQGFAPMSGFMSGGNGDPYGRATQGAAMDFYNQGLQRKQQSQLFGLGQQGENYRAGLQAQAAELPALLQQSRFGSVLPLLQGALSNGFNTSRVGGQSTPAPNISTGPVWNDQQIQGQVNQQYAQNNQQAATQNRDTSARVAGMGFGSNSPLQQALQNQTNMNLLGQNASANQSIRWNAAQGNAQQRLASQEGQSQQWNQANMQDIERRKAALQYQSSLFGALSGLV